jgi:hypothetical protein
MDINQKERVIYPLRKLLFKLTPQLAVAGDIDAIIS